jgi:phage-related protein
VTKVIDSATQAQLESRTPKTLLLFEFYLDVGTQRYTDCDRDITWSGYIYESFPVALGEIKYSATGMIERITLGVSNVSRTFSSLMLSQTFRGRKLVVRRATFDSSGYGLTPSFEVFNGLMDDAGGAEQKDSASVQITAANELAFWQMPVPGRAYQVGCEWASKGRFKGVECRYAGAGITCDGTWSQCKTYANQANFGGFRHLPQIENTPLYWGKAAPGITPTRIYY